MNNQFLTINEIDSDVLITRTIIQPFAQSVLNSLFSSTNPIVEVVMVYWDNVLVDNIFSNFAYNYPLYNYSIPLAISDILYKQIVAIINMKWAPKIFKLYNQISKWLSYSIKDNNLTIQGFQTFFSSQRSTKGTNTNTGSGTNSGMNASSYDNPNSSGDLTMLNDPKTMSNIKQYDGNTSLSNQTNSGTNTNVESDYVYLDIMSKLMSMEFDMVSAWDFAKDLYYGVLVRSW